MCVYIYKAYIHTHISLHICEFVWDLALWAPSWLWARLSSDGARLGGLLRGGAVLSIFTTGACKRMYNARSCGS